MSQWYFQPIFDSYALVTGLAVILVLLLFLRPPFTASSRRRRRILSALRLTVIVLVVLGMLRPTRVSTKTRPQTATVVFLLDRSRSMEMPDVGPKTRWQALHDTVQLAAPSMLQLAENMQVQAYAFDATVAATTVTEGVIKLDDKPTGSETDIGTAIDEVLRLETGKRLAGVFLLGDGAQRATAPRVDLQTPVRELARRNAPLYTVCFGLPRDQTQARDVAIDNLADQFTVFAKNELAVRGTLRAQGFVNQPLPVELLVEAPDGTTQTVGPVMVQSLQDGEELDVELTYTPQLPGQYKLTLQTPARPGEQVTENNSLSAFLNVLEGGLRVLFIDGNIAWQERKFIRRALDESPDIQLDLWLDTSPRDKTPIQLPPPDEQQRYDVIIVGDMDAARLGVANANRIAADVDQGTGFMMLGGMHSFGPGGYAPPNPLAKVLPVKMKRFERQRVDGPLRTELHTEGEVQMVPARDHFIVRLSPDLDQRATWQQLPPLLGANKFRELSDRALVLASSPQGDPLLVMGQFGLGRVLALAGDSTFRWYRYGFQQQHKRFWRQAVLWLAQKEDTQKQDVWIRMEQRRFLPGAPVTFEVGALDAGGDPIPDASFEVTQVAPDGTRQPVRVVRQEDQWTGTLDALSLPGDYRLEVVATRGELTIGETAGKFMIVDQDLELADPAANPQQLEMLAQLTSAAGGRSVAPEQLPDLLEELANRPNESELDFQSKWRLGDTSADASLYFLCIVSLLSVEWFLRKRWGLV